LTTESGVVIFSNVKARCLVDRRIVLSPAAFVEIVIWRLPEPSPGREYGYKYRLALVSREVCVFRYDNETGKGDHVHTGEVEKPYRFRDVDRLIADFMADVEEWRNEHGNS